MSPLMATPDAVLGTQELGSQISSVLFGALTVQTYIYYRKATNDGLVLKILVAIFWLLEFAGLISLWQGLYYISVTHYGDLQLLGSESPPTLTNIPFVLGNFHGPIAFFTARIRRFCGTLYIPILCWSLSAALFILGLASEIGAFTSSTLDEWEAHWTEVFTTIVVLGAFIDVTIAVSLCYHLMIRRDPLAKKTARLIDSLIKWTIQTGLITSIVAVATAATFLAAYNTYVWIILYMVLARLFPNTMLASLNARTKFRNLAHSSTGIESTTHMPRSGAQPVFACPTSKLTPTNLTLGRHGIDTDVELCNHKRPPQVFLTPTSTSLSSSLGSE